MFTEIHAQLVGHHQFKSFTKDVNGCTLGAKAHKDGDGHLSGFIPIFLFPSTFLLFSLTKMTYVAKGGKTVNLHGQRGEE